MARAMYERINEGTPTYSRMQLSKIQIGMGHGEDWRVESDSALQFPEFDGHVLSTLEKTSMSARGPYLILSASNFCILGLERWR